jgi:O-acetylserine/cysteine efflux transporter
VKQAFAPRDVALAVLVAAIWGFNFVIIKWGVAEVPPLLLTGLRFLFTALPALFFVGRPTSRIGILIAYGALLGVIKFGLLFVAMYLGLSASLASVVLQMQAFFTVGLAMMLLGERVTPPQLAGAALAMAGIAVIAAGRWQAVTLLPLALCMLAALSWGGANVLARRSGEHNMFAFVVWSALVPPLPLFGLSWLFEDHGEIIRALTMPSMTAILSLAYLVLASTILGFGLWNSLIHRYSASAVAPFSLLVPVFGIISGVSLMGDTLTYSTLVGVALVFAGLAINVFGPRRLARR